MKRKHYPLSYLSLTLLLMSFNNQSTLESYPTLKIKSEIAQTTLYVEKCYNEFDSHNSIIPICNGFNTKTDEGQTVSSEQINCEAYRTLFNGPYKDMIPAYMVLYRLDVFLESDVFFKGGFMGAFDCHYPCYIKQLGVNTTYEGNFSAERNFIQSPSNDYSSSFLPTYADHSTEYTENDYNPQNYTMSYTNGHYSWLVSKSYHDAASVCVDTDTDRLHAKIEHGENVVSTSNKVTGNVSMIYHGLGENGPISTDHKDYYFSVYGSTVLESLSEPKDVKLDFSYQIEYGTTGFNKSRTDTKTCSITIPMKS